MTFESLKSITDRYKPSESSMNINHYHTMIDGTIIKYNTIYELWLKVN